MCEYIYIYITYIYIYIYIYTHTYIYIYIYILYIYIYIYTHTNLYLYIHKHIYIYIRGAYDKFPDIFRMCTFIDSTHMKTLVPFEVISAGCHMYEDKEMFDK